MKTSTSILVAAIMPMLANASTPVITAPTQQCPSSFAIIVDDVTYNHCMQEINAYRDAVQSDGLSTWIVRSLWEDPMDVRMAIKKLREADPRLEGMVLVGDIPVAMIRNAQHMTTAFKMDEKAFPWPESSVPSDRFYDDLHLEFEYLRADSTQAHLFYYKLSESSPQNLAPDMYSARIRYPEAMGGNKYSEISAYLKKAANAKQENKSNRVDQVFAYNGDSYNSDCQIVWLDDEKAYRENFPLAFGRELGFKHWNFRMRHPMKYHLFDELRRDDVDVFMFHEHGLPTGQLINGEEICEVFDDRYRMLKSTLYNTLVAHSVRHDRDTMRMQMQEKYNLTDKFLGDLDSEDFWLNDSIHYADERITTEDFRLMQRISNPRFVMFDACYNGSFQEDDYMAAPYIFNPGKTIVAQGNTRNVLQDRWTIEMLGLLSHGVRVGQYNRLIASLEGHLLGDPTMHFAPIEDNSINTDITLKRADREHWMKMLDSRYADVQALSLRMLADADEAGTMSDMLLDVMKNSRFNVVRMEALKLLSRYGGDNFVEGIRIGLSDPYEMVARQSAIYAGNNGDEALLGTLVKVLIDDNERLRVQMSCNRALQLYPSQKVEKAVEDYYASSNRQAADEEKGRLLRSLQRTFDSDAKSHAVLMDKSAPEAKRIAAIRTVRNYPFHFHVSDYLSVVADDENPAEVRTVMAEALGWFGQSHRQAEILDAIKNIPTDSMDDDLKDEIAQTINRLEKI